MKRIIVGLSIGLTAGFTLLLAIAGDRGLPAVNGILNFGQVNTNLYRGAQPDAAAIKNLRQLGVKTIISLRMPNEGAATEAAEALANGITYTNVPWRGVGRPSDAQVKQVLGIIQNAKGPVFVHCEHGCDRTGTIIACYRIQHDQWKNQAAMEEAERYGISKLEHGMRSYIADFGKPAK